MKKLLQIILVLCFLALPTQAATEQDALNFFKSYVSAANSYSDSIQGMYAPRAVIIRQVIKPNGELVNVYTDTATYLKQMKISENVARVRKYKNNYTNISVTKVAKGYKVSATRQPSADNDRLKMYQILAPQSNGKFLIVEEMMQTRQQIFLKYKK